jgi:hypothetical protein
VFLSNVSLHVESNPWWVAYRVWYGLARLVSELCTSRANQVRLGIVLAITSTTRLGLSRLCHLAAVHIYTLWVTQSCNIVWEIERKQEIKKNLERAIRTLGDKSSLCVGLSSFMWLIRGQILTIGIRARSKIWSYACPGEATHASASERAIVGQRSDRVKMASMLPSARRRVIARLAKQHGGGGRALSSARWTRMIVDGRGGAEVRC